MLKIIPYHEIYYYDIFWEKVRCCAHLLTTTIV